jgi:maleylacetate reductase
LAGHTLGVVGTGLHHKICHVLGGSFDLPHAAVHAAVLPFVTAVRLPTAPSMEQVLPGEGSPAGRLQRLARQLGCPTSLASLGMGEGDLSRAATPVGAPEALAILQAAWRGDDIK